MKLIRYLMNKAMLPLYLLAAAVIAAVLALLSDGFIPSFFPMLPIVLCLLIAIRVFDDIFDYEKDSTRKTQYLSKKELIILCCVISAVYVILNNLFFGIFGALSIAAIGYILLMEKLPVLKMLFMALLFLYYFRLNCERVGAMHIAVCVGCIAVSALFYFYKLHKRKVRK